MWKNLFQPQYLKWRWSFCISLGVYLYLFVAFCEPFKDDKITYVWASEAAYIQNSLLNFALNVLSCAFTLIFVPHYFPNYVSPENLSFRRFNSWVMFTVFLIESGYFLANYIFFHHELSLVWYMTFMLKTTLASFLFVGFPFLFLFLLVFNHFTEFKIPTHRLSESPLFNDFESVDTQTDKIAEVIPQITPPQYETVKPPVMLQFTDISNKKQLDVSLDNLYYITSSQNYIEIFYKNKNGKPSSQLLRNTLKTVEEELMNTANLPLVRCHKAFIVNLDKVVELRGTAKTAHFILVDMDTQIPVSRHKFADFEGKIPVPKQVI